MVWPILISASVTPGAFSAAADIDMAPLASKQPNKIRNTARPLSPSMWPVVLRQWRNAGSSRPQTAGCCAPAASGQAVAPLTPLRSAMKNPLRLMSSPRFEDRTLPHRWECPLSDHGKISRRWPSWVYEQIRSPGRGPLCHQIEHAGASPPHVRQRRTRTSPHIQSAHARGAHLRGRGCFPRFIRPPSTLRAARYRELRCPCASRDRPSRARWFCDP